MKRIAFSIDANVLAKLRNGWNWPEAERQLWETRPP
jgi:hypothetical protein